MDRTRRDLRRCPARRARGRTRNELLAHPSSQRLLRRQCRGRHVLEFDRKLVLDERRGVAGAARLVLPQGSTGGAAILVGFALRGLEIARRAELMRTLLDALFGMAYAIGEFAAVRNPV